MKTIGRLFYEYSKTSPRTASLHLALKMLGFDANSQKETTADEEVWRTSEEGRHFKLETTTGEIKAGFGGKFNGEKLGSVFKNSAAGRKQAAAAPKTVETPKAPALTESQKANVESLRQKVQGFGDTGVGRAFGRHNEDLQKAKKFLKEYETFPETKKQEYAGVRKSYLDSMAETQAKMEACREELKKRGLWDEEHQDAKPFPTNTPQQDKALRKIEKRIANLKNEQSFIVGPDGEIRAQAKGDKHSVGMTVGTNREHLPGAISLHNHPAGGTFSYDDLDDFGYGATEIRVSTPEGTYTLRNQRYGRGEVNGGWLGMRDALEKAVPAEVSVLDLMKQADANLKGNETRRKLEEIAQTWVKMKDAGASNEILQAYFDKSGYDELSKKAAQERKDEIRRLETEPFHEFYKQHAAEYGFEYTFTPENSKGKKETQAEQPKLESETESQNESAGTESASASETAVTAPSYRETPTMKAYDELMPIYKESYDNYIDEVKRGYSSTSPEQAAAIDTYSKRTPEYERILKDALDKHDFSARTKSNAILGILQDGRMKSQIETGESNGHKDIQMRKSLAVDLFNGGDALEIGDDQYELYGFLDHAERAKMYGDCRIVFKKDNVKTRTTFTVGDSLQQKQLGNSQVPTLVTDPKIYSLGMNPFSGASLPKEVLERTERTFSEIAQSGKTATDYVELQFHGGIQTSDIEYLEIPKNSQDRAQIESLAKQRGVEIRWKD